jgi:hypothetical protein
MYILCVEYVGSYSAISAEECLLFSRLTVGSIYKYIYRRARSQQHLAVLLNTRSFKYCYNIVISLVGGLLFKARFWLRSWLVVWSIDCGWSAEWLIVRLVCD